jgi:MinD-like ATPase involved in chromosome partitioning or flagellar assembly
VTLVAFCSGKGSPGVSTLSCVVGAVWPHERQVVVAECDPSGNDLAARFGLYPRLGMTSLVLGRRHSSEHTNTIVGIHAQTLPGGLDVLVGPVSPDASNSLDQELGALGPSIFPVGVDTLVDCGRIVSGARGQQEIVKGADHVVVAARPDAAGLAHAQWALDLIRNLTAADKSSLVVVGSGPFRIEEIERTLQARLLGVIPLDYKSAATVCGSPGRPSRFARSSLVAAARRLVDRLVTQLEPTSEGTDSVELVGQDRYAGGATMPVPAHLEFRSSNGQGAKPR